MAIQRHVDRWMLEEKERGSSCNLPVLPCKWNLIESVIIGNGGKSLALTI
jgi:hypothetical protein